MSFRNDGQQRYLEPGNKIKVSNLRDRPKKPAGVLCPSPSLASKLAEIFASHSSPVNARLREEKIEFKQISGRS